MTQGKSTPFSEFIRNGSPEEKARVYGDVMERVVERQREIIEQANRPTEAWMWEHVDNATGKVQSCGLSFTKVEPTNNTFWDGKVSTRVTHMIAQAVAASQQVPDIPVSAVKAAAEAAGLHFVSRSNGQCTTTTTVSLDCLVEIVRAAVTASRPG